MHGHTVDHHRKMKTVVKDNISFLPFLGKILKTEAKLNKPGMGQIL